MRNAGHSKDVAIVESSCGGHSAPLAQGFCILVEAVHEGYVPALRCEHGRPRVFATRSDAERAIAGVMITSLQEFIEGKRAFDDATNFKEFIVEVDVLPDGKVINEDGCIFA